MEKYLILFFFLGISINSISQTDKQISNKEVGMLIGKWKAVLLRLTDDQDSNRIIRVDLTDSKSIQWFSDTVWYKGLYGKLKAEGDTSLKAKRLVKEASHVFEDMDNTFITFKIDTTYTLNNQSVIFGFASDGTVFTTLTGHKYYFGQSVLFEGQNTIVFNVAKADDRDYVIVKLTMDTLIIDEGWRDVNSKPIKEISFKKQN